MIGVLLATDSDVIFNEVDSALASDDLTVWRVRSGTDVIPVIKVKEPEVVLLDMRIGNMGGIATCLAIRQEEGFDRLMHRPVALLLDRSADTFLAREAKAEGQLLKPINPLELQSLVHTLAKEEAEYDSPHSNAAASPAS